MSINLKQIKIGEEALVELKGNKFFYGIVAVINNDSVILKKVRQVVNGVETPMGDQEKQIKFPLTAMEKIQPSVASVEEIMIEVPSQPAPKYQQQ